MRRFLISAVLTFALCAPALAATEALPLVGRDTGLTLPRFASLKSDEVFVRAGPGQRYPIKFVYQRDALPIQIVNEFGGWRKVRDARGGEGWVYNALISGTRTALVRADGVMVRREARESSAAVAELSEGVIAEIKTCDGDHCRVKGEGFDGWTPRDSLWGIGPKESFED